MRIELAACTQTLLQEIESREFTRDSVAKTYRLAMASSEAVDWARVNRAIVARWSLSALEYIKPS